MRLSQIANELLYYGSNFGWPRNLGLENGQAGGGIPYLRSGHPTIDIEQRTNRRWLDDNRLVQAPVVAHRQRMAARISRYEREILHDARKGYYVASFHYPPTVSSEPWQLNPAAINATDPYLDSKMTARNYGPRRRTQTQQMAYEEFGDEWPF